MILQIPSLFCVFNTSVRNERRGRLSNVTSRIMMLQERETLSNVTSRIMMLQAWRKTCTGSLPTSFSFLGGGGECMGLDFRVKLGSLGLLKIGIWAVPIFL